MMGEQKNTLNLLSLKTHFMIHLEVKCLPKVALGLEDTLKYYCSYKNFSSFWTL